MFVSENYLVDRMDIPDFSYWKFQIYTLSVLVTPIEREWLPDSICRKLSEVLL